MAKRSGVVTELEYPNGNGPIVCQVGGRVVRVWPTDQNGDDNYVVGEIEAAYENETSITLDGYTKPYKGKAQFYATDVLDGDDDDDDDDEDDEKPRKPQSTKGKPKPKARAKPKPRAKPGKKYVGREPGTADNWTALRWAVSSALEQLRHEGATVWATGEGLDPAVVELARYLFQETNALLAETSLGATQEDDD